MLVIYSSLSALTLKNSPLPVSGEHAAPIKLYGLKRYPTYQQIPKSSTLSVVHRFHFAQASNICARPFQHLSLSVDYSLMEERRCNALPGKVCHTSCKCRSLRSESYCILLSAFLHYENACSVPCTRTALTTAWHLKKIPGFTSHYTSLFLRSLSSHQSTRFLRLCSPSLATCCA